MLHTNFCHLLANQAIFSPNWCVYSVALKYYFCPSKMSTNGSYSWTSGTRLKKLQYKKIKKHGDQKSVVDANVPFQSPHDDFLKLNYHPTQISATEFEVMWTKELTAALQSAADCRDEYKRLHRVFDNLAKRLLVRIAGDVGINIVVKTVVSHTASSNAVSMKSRTKNLLTLAMEKRNLCRDFLRRMVTTVDDYNWQSLLRTSLDSESGNGICLLQGRAKLSYGNEFHSPFLG